MAEKITHSELLMRLSNGMKDSSLTEPADLCNSQGSEGA